MSKILLIAATTGYQARAFEEAARKLGWTIVLATDRCHRLEDPWADQAIPIRFEAPLEAVETLQDSTSSVDGVVAVGDRPTSIAAALAAQGPFRFHPVAAVEACRNKFLARERFAAAGLLVPAYFRVSLWKRPAEAARGAQYPCVLKPLGLSGSRGVMRANNETEFVGAFRRIGAILNTPELRQLQREQDRFVQVEAFIEGREFALEGLVTDGCLQTLAIFDKPDPLDGPFFEESIYVTPSRESDSVQEAIRETTQRAVAALGLTNGPIHAEMRANRSGIWMLEVAARPIGGLCSRALRFAGDRTLEELVLRHAIGEKVDGWRREAGAAGVMMIPIPKAGMYVGFRGAEAALAVPGIRDVVITAKAGQRLLQLPEGNAYLGFIFSTGETPEEAEAALRRSHEQLHFEIATELGYS